MSLADATLAALKGFATEVSTWTNQGSLLSINEHIAQIESAAAQDVHAAETAAKAVWADLYGAFHGHTTEPVGTADPTVSASSSGSAATPSAAPSSEPATAPEPAGTATASGLQTLTPPATPAPADPTAAPSTITEGSSAPSSMPSTTTTETEGTAS